MKYRVHRFSIKMTTDQDKLEQFLNSLEGVKALRYEYRFGVCKQAKLRKDIYLWLGLSVGVARSSF